MALLVAARTWPALVPMVAAAAPGQAADLLAGLSDEDRRALVRALPLESSRKVFAYLPRVQRAARLGGRPASKCALVAAPAPDDRTLVFGNLPSAAVERLIAGLGAPELAGRWPVDRHEPHAPLVPAFGGT